jgi:hypothetical protein
MHDQLLARLCAYFSLLAALTLGCRLVAAVPAPAFNVRDYGATGNKNQDARPAIQRTLDAAAAAGGGTVYFPPGEYTSGTIHLRSHVRLYMESGATLLASPDGKAFDKEALLYGENLENITLEGRGTVDGQAEYEWRLNDLDDAYIGDNARLMKALGKPLLRPFPKGFPKATYPKLVLLIRCRDVRIAGLSFVRSRSWTIHPYACERLVIDGVYIHSSLKEGVWADGIDPDGCRDVRIANSTIETGDDAIVFYSMNFYGPALPCEDITITNCRLSSASSALKFCDGNMNSIRRVTVDNVVITRSNRGLAFMVFDGGYVSDVVIANLTIDCRRHDWFWWGDGDPIHFNIKRRSEVHSQAPRDKEPPPGSIRNVLIRNVIARGQGCSFINGHPESWLQNVALENVRLSLAADPASPYDKTSHAMKVRWADGLRIKDVAVAWGDAVPDKWQSALSVEDARGLEIDGFRARQARAGADAPAVLLRRVDGATFRNSAALDGTGLFLRIEGPGSRKVRLLANDLSSAVVPYSLGAGLSSAEVRLAGNLLPERASPAKRIQ